MNSQHLYSVKLKNEGEVTQYDERNLEEYTKHLESGEATLLNGELQVKPDDIIEIKELPDPDMRSAT
jgi:hypothetical protein